jgi:hypothetical protein
LAAILVVAAVLVNLRPRERAQPVQLVPVVVATEDIAPYSIIESDQVIVGSTEMPETLAKDYYLDAEAPVGFMTTRFVKAGQQISREDAKPIESVRYVEDMGLEIVSFPAVFSEMVAGQVKPGHKINVYGYREQTGKDNPGEAVLVASNVWVVDVRTATGDEVRQEGQQSAEEGGLFTAPSVGVLAQPASVVAVAAPPEVVQDLIYAFGARGYEAWVTLAPRPGVIPPITSLATPTPPLQQPGEGAQPTPTLIEPEPSSLVGAIHMSDRDGGPKIDVFPNNTSVVWAVVNLQYSPDGAVPIRIVIHDAGGAPVFDDDFVHPQSGQRSYLIVPANGFAPSASYTTTLHVSGKTFSVDWRLQGNAVLPKTGGDD